MTVWMLASLTGWMLPTLRLAWEVWKQPDGLRALLVLATAACVFALARDVYVGRAGALYFEESAYEKHAAVLLALCVLTIVSTLFKRARVDLFQSAAAIGPTGVFA